MNKSAITTSKDTIPRRKSLSKSISNMLLGGRSSNDDDDGGDKESKDVSASTKNPLRRSSFRDLLLGPNNNNNNYSANTNNSTTTNNNNSTSTKSMKNHKSNSNDTNHRGVVPPDRSAEAVILAVQLVDCVKYCIQLIEVIESQSLLQQQQQQQRLMNRQFVSVDSSNNNSNNNSSNSSSSGNDDRSTKQGMNSFQDISTTTTTSNNTNNNTITPPQTTVTPFTNHAVMKPPSSSSSSSAYTTDTAYNSTHSPLLSPNLSPRRGMRVSFVVEDGSDTINTSSNEAMSVLNGSGINKDDDDNNDHNHHINNRMTSKSSTPSSSSSSYQLSASSPPPQPPQQRSSDTGLTRHSFGEMRYNLSFDSNLAIPNTTNTTSSTTANATANTAANTAGVINSTIGDHRSSFNNGVLSSHRKINHPKNNSLFHSHSHSHNNNMKNNNRDDRNNNNKNGHFNTLPLMMNANSSQSLFSSTTHRLNRQVTEILLNQTPIEIQIMMMTGTVIRLKKSFLEVRSLFSVACLLYDRYVAYTTATATATHCNSTNFSNTTTTTTTTTTNNTDTTVHNKQKADKHRNLINEAKNMKQKQQLVMKAFHGFAFYTMNDDDNDDDDDGKNKMKEKRRKTTTTATSTGTATDRSTGTAEVQLKSGESISAFHCRNNIEAIGNVQADESQYLPWTCDYLWSLLCHHHHHEATSGHKLQKTKRRIVKSDHSLVIRLLFRKRTVCSVTDLTQSPSIRATNHHHRNDIPLHLSSRLNLIPKTTATATTNTNNNHPINLQNHDVKYHTIIATDAAATTTATTTTTTTSDHIRIDLLFAEETRYINAGLYVVNQQQKAFLAGIQVALSWMNRVAGQHRLRDDDDDDDDDGRVHNKAGDSGDNHEEEHDNNNNNDDDDDSSSNVLQLMDFDSSVSPIKWTSSSSLSSSSSSLPLNPLRTEDSNFNPPDDPPDVNSYHTAPTTPEEEGKGMFRVIKRGLIKVSDDSDDSESETSSSSSSSTTSSNDDDDDDGSDTDNNRSIDQSNGGKNKYSSLKSSPPPPLSSSSSSSVYIKSYESLTMTDIAFITDTLTRIGININNKNLKKNTNHTAAINHNDNSNNHKSVHSNINKINDSSHNHTAATSKTHNMKPVTTDKNKTSNNKNISNNSNNKSNKSINTTTNHHNIDDDNNDNDTVYLKEIVTWAARFHAEMAASTHTTATATASSPYPSSPPPVPPPTTTIALSMSMLPYYQYTWKRHYLHYIQCLPLYNSYFFPSVLLTAIPATAAPATAAPATAVPATAVPATAVPAIPVPAAAVHNTIHNNQTPKKDQELLFSDDKKYRHIRVVVAVSATGFRLLEENAYILSSRFNNHSNNTSNSSKGVGNNSSNSNINSSSSRGDSRNNNSHTSGISNTTTTTTNNNNNNNYRRDGMAGSSTRSMLVFECRLDDIDSFHIHSEEHDDDDDDEEDGGGEDENNSNSSSSNSNGHHDGHQDSAMCLVIQANEWKLQLHTNHAHEILRVLGSYCMENLSQGGFRFGTPSTTSSTTSFFNTSSNEMKSVVNEENDSCSHCNRQYVDEMKELICIDNEHHSSSSSSSSSVVVGTSMISSTIESSLNALRYYMHTYQYTIFCPYSPLILTQHDKYFLPIHSTNLSETNIDFPMASISTAVSATSPSSLSRRQSRADQWNMDQLVEDTLMKLEIEGRVQRLEYDTRSVAQDIQRIHNVHKHHNHDSNNDNNDNNKKHSKKKKKNITGDDNRNDEEEDNRSDISRSSSSTSSTSLSSTSTSTTGDSTSWGGNKSKNKSKNHHNHHHHQSRRSSIHGNGDNINTIYNHESYTSRHHHHHDKQSRAMAIIAGNSLRESTIDQQFNHLDSYSINHNHTYNNNNIITPTTATTPTTTTRIESTRQPPAFFSTVRKVPPPLYSFPSVPDSASLLLIEGEAQATSTIRIVKSKQHLQQ